MSLLAEEVVEEWLNRHGYFTIRGIRVGVGEIDILAIRPQAGGQCECRHIEVQVSINPISYITKVPAAIRKKTGIAPHNAKKRDIEQLKQGIEEWVEGKFDQPSKVDLRNSLCQGHWSKELVVGRVKYEEELALLIEAGVRIHRLKDVLLQMHDKGRPLKAASGADLLDLMQLGE